MATSPSTGYDPEMRLYGGEEMEIGAVETRQDIYSLILSYLILSTYLPTYLPTYLSIYLSIYHMWCQNAHKVPIFVPFDAPFPCFSAADTVPSTASSRLSDVDALHSDHSAHRPGIPRCGGDIEYLPCSHALWPKAK